MSVLEVMRMNKFLDEKVMEVKIKACNRDEALDNLSRLLYKEGYVEKTYMDAIKEREKTFATGLPTEGVGVAIPHASIEYVKKPIIGVGILENPIEFHVMGNHDETVSVGILFMLALNEHHAQVEMLQNLMGLIQDKELLIKMIHCSTTEDLLTLLENKL